MAMVYGFPGDGAPTLAEVGGKGLSLIKMAQSGLPVPPGFVLTVEFFRPWIDELRRTPEWREFLDGTPDRLAAHCAALKGLCAHLALVDSQERALRSAFDAVGRSSSARLFAVRSSSPEEDLEGASFAGGYETLLGVCAEGIEHALRRTFASCLDQRVVLYKKEHGFDTRDPRIAVIVQEQVASDVAGVGFSLNPVNNCYDEAVVDANWGLGESVVAGMASPDQFVVDKVERKILQRNLGKKEMSVWLTPDGGTTQRADPRRSELALSDEQVMELTDILIRIEELYGKPMDIEWAYSQGRLFMLQARPITTHIPLPDEMLTAPGEPRRLYLDATLTVQGIHEPMSVMGSTWLSAVLSELSTEVFGVSLVNNIRDGIPFQAGGRLYSNLCNALLLIRKESLARFFTNMDTLASQIIGSIDEERYLNRAMPDLLKGLRRKALWRVPDAIARVFEAGILPGQLERSYRRGIQKLVAELRVESEKGLPVVEFAKASIASAIRFILHFSVPTIAAFLIAKSRVRALFRDDPPEVRDHVEHLDRSLPGNVTVEMGLALYHLSQLLDPEGIDSMDALAHRIEERSLPGEFLHAWDDFLETYGFRGAREIDVASPRFRDDPAMLLQQLIQMARVNDPNRNPQAVYDRSQMERHRAYETLSEVAHGKGWLASKKFHMLYRTIETFGGYRETHKYYLIMINHMFRERVLAEADRLVAAGRLDDRRQIFDLTIDDLDEGLKNPSLNLRARAEERTRFLSRIRHVRNFPHVIDSRGTILHPPPREAKEGELAGQPVSVGVARGPVKVLHSPDEKPVLPGDILVTRATDPGWTPLFINAAAIVLEVGGALQHGALVAREYGKPCVVGIENVASILSDGEIVEVDGASGVVRTVRE